MAAETVDDIDRRRPRRADGRKVMDRGQHTPGPWHRNIPPASKYPTIFAGRNTHVAAVVRGRNLSDAEMEANCDLIAAAPDLLAAAKKVLADLNSRIAAAPDSAVPVYNGIADLAAAVAKAEGGR